jgi:HEAT repeat protein
MFSGGGHIEETIRDGISPASVQRLIDAAGRATGSSLRQFVIVLGWLRGPEVKRALALLLGTPGVQQELLEAIVRFGAPMVDRLIEQLVSDDAETRRAAVVALGRIGDARAVEPLIRLLEEDDRDLLVAVTAALAHLGDGRAFEALLRLVGDVNVSVRQGAIGALNSIGHPDMSARIRRLLEDSDPAGARIGGQDRRLLRLRLLHGRDPRPLPRHGRDRSRCCARARRISRRRSQRADPGDGDGH